MPNSVLSQSDSLMKEWSRSEGEALEKRASHRGKAWHEIFELLIGASLRMGGTGRQVRSAPWPGASRLNVVDHRGVAVGRSRFATCCIEPIGPTRRL